MAADETDSDRSSRKRPPSGKPRREPPVIEAEAVSVAAEAKTQEPVQPDAPVTSDAPPPADPVEPSVDSVVPPNGAAAPRAGGLSLPLVAALLGGVAGLGLAGYVWQGDQQSAATIAALERDVATLRTQSAPAAAPAGVEEGLTALARRLDALEKRPVTVAPATTDGEAVAGLTRRVEALDQRLQSQPIAATSALEERLATLEHGAQTAAAEVAARPVAAPVDLAPLDARIAGLDKRLAALETEMRATKTEVRAREAPLAAVSQRGQAAGLAVVAQAIAQAVERGTPFAADLASAESLGADPARLAPLRAVADKGAPTVQALAAQWASLSRGAIAADGAAAEDAGLLGRLSASAARLVRVRPVGEVTGDDPAALAARITAALARGAVTEALAMWGQLPEPGRATSAAFADAARRRVAAEEAAGALVSAAVADLARPKGAP